MGSQDQLVADLMRKPRDSLRDQLIANAVAGTYHDYKSEHALPKLRLVEDLTRYGYRDLARKAKRGEYDDKMDAEDIAESDRMIAEDPVLAEAWEKMKGTKDPAEALAMLVKALPISEEQKVLAMAEVFPEGHRSGGRKS